MKKPLICLSALLISAGTMHVGGAQNATSAPAALSWTQIAAKAGDACKGELAVTPTDSGARLRCAFQRLEGEATSEGLWLSSTSASSRECDRFRVTAVELGSGSVVRHLDGIGSASVNGQKVRFTRAGVTEEYSVGLDGVRQDFMVEQPSCRSRGEMVLKLAVTGARVEKAFYGARLVLAHSGRQIAYSQLRVTDATGRQLTSRMQVSSEKEQAGEGELAIIVEDADAIYPVRIDPTFSDNNWVTMGGNVSGVGGYVPGIAIQIYAAAVDASGNLYIGGNFTLAGATVANGVAEWNGTNWLTLGSGVSGVGDDEAGPYVNALLISGNSLYVGGDFYTAGGTAAKNIAQWNGTNWSALGSGLSGTGMDGGGPFVYTLAISGSTLYVGGDFATAGGNAANSVAEWSGGSWSALGTGMDSAVSSLGVAGSTLYAGGYFTNAGGSEANYIAQWNGSAWSSLGTGMNGNVYALAMAGSTLYAGGDFTSAGEGGSNFIAQWDGSSWTSLGSGMDGDVWALAVAGSSLYAGGGFSMAGGVSANDIAQWNGSSWSALGAGVGGADVYALAISGESLYAGGVFTNAGGIVAGDVAQWSGTAWSALANSSIASGVGGPVSTVAALSTSNVYVGGSFGTAGSVLAVNVAVWNGSNWAGMGSGINGPVTALATSGSNLYAGGSFTGAGGAGATNVAKWNGSAWSGLGSGLVGEVTSLAVVGTNLYAGGTFSGPNGPTDGGTNILVWNGSAWITVLGWQGTAFNGIQSYTPIVSALAASSNALYAGGSFGLTATSVVNVAQYKGNSWTTLGPGISGAVNALALSSTNLYAGGQFFTAGHAEAINVAVWNGSVWTNLGSGLNFPISALAVWENNLYAGGNGVEQGTNYIAVWNGTNWAALGSGLDNSVTTLAVSGATLYAGGNFTTAGGKVSTYMAEAQLLVPLGGMVESIAFSRGTATATIGLLGNPGAFFDVQRTTNLAVPADWTTVNNSPLSPATNGLFNYTDIGAPTPNGYYRLRQR